MTTKGGSGLGTIFKTDTNGNNQTVIHHFGTNHGSKSGESVHLCLAPNGKFYGMSFGGGAYDLGVIFEYDPVTNIYTKKIDFNGINGKNPYGSFTVGTNGNLYGMTWADGKILEYSVTSNSLTVLDNVFFPPSGGQPHGSLLQVSNGKFYGLVQTGGLNGFGCIFSYDLSTSTKTSLLDFTGSVGTKNGSYPLGSFIEASNGKLYAMTNYGGNNNFGVLFEFDPSTNVYSKKFDFVTALGRYPTGNIMQASNGNLYGMTTGGGANGGGVIFEYNIATSTYSVIKNFAGIDGGEPRGSLIQGLNGKLYGATHAGGLTNVGVLFEHDLTNNTYNKLHDFNIIDGLSPAYEGLSQLPNGKIYGMCNGTQAFGNPGVIFEFDPATNIYTKKIDFNSDINGSWPTGSLISATNGKIYGTTKNGGINNFGTLFEFDPNTNTYTKKVDFNDAGNGKNPNGDIMQASNGKIYGTTTYGGINNFGVLFEYDPSTSIFVKHLNFAGSSNGEKPIGKLVQASNGKLYGTTTEGGTGIFGTIFEFDPATNVFTKKIDFVNSNLGSFPNGAMVETSPGILYGSGNGIIFEYNYTSNIYTKKFDCTFNTCLYPTGAFIKAPNGKLYGISNFQSGMIFEYDIASSTATSVINFNGPNGEYSDGSLLLGSNGKAYGYTWKGGVNDCGVIFELNTNTNSYQKQLDFNFVNGSKPQYGSLIKACQSISIAVQPIASTICINGFMSQTVSAIGTNLTYQWFYNNIAVSNATNTVYSTSNFNSANAGNYYCQITNGCRTVFTNTVTVTLGSNTAPILNISGINTICIGSSTNLNANGANSYTWSTNSNNNVINVNPTIATTYSVLGTGANNCIGLTSVLVSVNPLPVILISGASSVCIGSSANFTASGAITYTWNTNANTTTINVLPVITTTYNVSGTDLNNCVNTQSVILAINNTCADVWPGDANSDGITDNLDVLELGLHFTQTGAARTPTSNNWQPYFANNWIGLITNGKNLCHSDCDGNGLIDQNDTLAIFNNYTFTHAFKGSSQITTNTQLYIMPDQNFVTMGNWGSASIYFGDSLNQITNVNGLAYTFVFDETYIEQDSVYIKYPISFLNANNQNLHFRKRNFNNGVIYTASTHTNNLNVSGYGKIATFHFKVKSNLAIDTAFNMNIQQANQSSANGAIIPLTTGSASLMAIGATVNMTESFDESKVSIYPNPTKNSLKVNSSKEIQKIELLNIAGQILLSEIGKGNTHQLNLELFANGTYFIKVYSANEPSTQKIIIKN